MRFAKDAPVIGLVLQRSHLVTGDEGHYSGVVASLEAQGAKVRPWQSCLSVTVALRAIDGRAIYTGLVRLLLCGWCNAKRLDQHSSSTSGRSETGTGAG